MTMKEVRQLREKLAEKEKELKLKDEGYTLLVNDARQKVSRLESEAEEMKGIIMNTIRGLEGGSCIGLPVEFAITFRELCNFVIRKGWLGERKSYPEASASRLGPDSLRTRRPAKGKEGK